MHFYFSEDLRRLIEYKRGPCVSLFMHTQRAGRETLQNPIRFKNLLREARNHPLVQDFCASENDDLLAPAQPLVEDLPFWQHQDKGLALFVAPGLFWYARLPLDFSELVVVTDAFHLKPLLPLLTSDDRFSILALSQNQIRFFRASRHAVVERHLPTLPTSMSEALREDNLQKQLQFRTEAQGRRGQRPAQFHGHGPGKEDEKDRILEYFRRVDQAVQEVLREEPGPLVLMGVDYLLPIYREANTCSFLLHEGASGNPERLEAEAIHEKALPIVEEHFVQERLQAMDRYKEALGTGLATARLEEIVPAACHGRVDCLFVALGVQRWGSLDPDSHTVSVHSRARSGDRDLLDLAAVHTLFHGGSVYALSPSEMPDGHVIGAIFRYGVYDPAPEAA